MDNYYNNNAKEFFEGTVDADMSAHYTVFLERLLQGAYILDAGCGSRSLSVISTKTFFNCIIPQVIKK